MVCLVFRAWEKFLGFIPESWKPNDFTRLRIGLAFLLIPFVVIDWLGVAFALYILAAFTDLIDGGLARARNQITAWGRKWDPVADKLLVLGPLTLAFLTYLHNWLLLGLLVVYIVVELTVIGVSWRILKREERRACPNVWGKAVTAWLGLVFVPLLFLGSPPSLMAAILVVGLFMKIVSLNGYIRRLLSPPH